MGGKIMSDCRIAIIASRAWSTKGWTKEKLAGWIKSAGGVLQTRFDEQSTTHLVVEEQAWENKVRHVQLALEANENGSKVYIVTPEWLEVCLTDQKKCSERTYMWGTLEKEASGGKRKDGGKKDGEGEEGGEDGDEGSKTHQAMLGEVLREGTEDYLGDHDLRTLAAELEGIKKAEKEREDAEARRKEHEKQAAEQQRKNRAELMKNSVKKGRGEVFNSNFHPFKDSTGVVYDIVLTKIDTLTNSNERLNLTIFESNTGVANTDNPPTYATNLHFAGTGKQPMNNILAALGSNFHTATRMFRKAFQEKTGSCWDDCIKTHNERVCERERDAGTPGLYVKRCGKVGNANSNKKEVPSEKRKFEYMPSIHTARGWLPDGKESMPKVLKQIRLRPNEQRDRTEEWTMSGCNSGSDDPSVLPRQSIEDSQLSAQTALTENDIAEQLINSMSAGGSNGLDGQMTSPGVDTVGGTDALGDDMFSNTTNAGALDVDRLLVGAQGWSAQDNISDIRDLAGQHEHQFVFDQNKTDFGNGQSGTGAAGLDDSSGNIDFGGLDTHVNADSLDTEEALPATGGFVFGAAMPGGGAFSSNQESLSNQTQLATMVGEDLLNLAHLGSADSTGMDGVTGAGPDTTAFSGLVVIPGTEKTEAAANSGKRERSEDAEEMEPAAKRFEPEEFAT